VGNGQFIGIELDTGRSSTCIGPKHALRCRSRDAGGLPEAEIATSGGCRGARNRPAKLGFAPELLDFSRRWRAATGGCQNTKPAPASSSIEKRIQIDAETTVDPGGSGLLLRRRYSAKLLQYVSQAVP